MTACIYRVPFVFSHDRLLKIEFFFLVVFWRSIRLRLLRGDTWRAPLHEVYLLLATNLTSSANSALFMTLSFICLHVYSIVITFRVSRRLREMCCGHARLCVCVCLYVCPCLSAAACLHYCTDPDVTWRSGRDAPSCALLGGFAIGTRVALLWQHNANAKC